MQRITGNQPHENFGAAVSLSGSTLLVGAPSSWEDPDDLPGTAYVYEVDGGYSWHETQILTENDLTPGARFGASVSASNDTWVVGAPRDSPSPTVSGFGSTYVYHHDYGNLYEQKLARAGDRGFGAFVSVSENKVLVGCDQGRLGGSGATVYRFDPDGWGSWNEEQFLEREEGEGGVLGAVSLCGDLAVVRGLRSNGESTAFIFQFGGGEWHSLYSLEPPCCTNSSFGRSIAASGQYVFVGTPDWDRSANSFYGFVQAYYVPSWFPTLEVSPASVRSGDTLTFTSSGVPTNILHYYIVRINNNPISPIRVLTGSYDGCGRHGLSATVPDEPGLAGNNLSFNIMTRGLGGSWMVTNEDRVWFH